MTIFKAIAAAISLLLLVCVSSARAVFTCDPTLEWLVCSSDVVAIGKVTSCQTVKGPSEVLYEDCVLSVSETLLGTRAKKRHFTCRHFPDETLKWKASKEELLICLSLCKTPYSETHLDHVFVPTGPLGQSNPDSIIILDAPGEYLFSGSFVQLTTKRDILHVARSAAASLAARRAAHPSFQVTDRDISTSELGSRILRVPEFMFPASK